MFLPTYKKFMRVVGFVGAGFIAMAATAAMPDFNDPERLSDNGSANKTKLIRMGSGWLISPYGDAVGPEVYDTKADGIRPARDIFVRVCHPANNTSQCSAELDWSQPINISNTANLTSISTDWNEDPEVIGATPFYGDSDKPNIFVSGKFAVITWVDKYCPGGKQRMISYDEREGLAVPFSCLYLSYTNNVAGLNGEPAVWNTLQFTDGMRDAKSDSNKGFVIEDGAVANWVISWQEDPHGLQIGGADGPGEGASGATVTHGTDIWYTYTENLMLIPWAAPIRISDNYTNDGSGGNTSPVFHPDDLENELAELERGNTGASRPNLMLVGGSSPATAVIAYEESKGAERLDSGKFIRYHEFAFNNPPVSAGQFENGEAGCIISDPLENSRRVRFVAQPNASPNGLRMGVFWRQGIPTTGGPGDIMARIGTTAAGGSGLRPEDMLPAVDTENCRTSDYLAAREMASVPANNVSSNTVPWSPVSCEEPAPTEPENNLADTTSFNPYEDSRAHRAAIVADDFYLGYSYAKDWALATYTDLDNYNFWIRRYNVASDSWSVAKNVTNIVDVKTHVKEPRLVKTPGSGMGCPTAYPENCQNKSTLIVAWGTESNIYSHVGSSVEGDIYYTRTRDKGVTFETPAVVPQIGDNNRFESQLRPSPGGNIIWSAWNEKDNANGGTHAMLSVSDESVGTPPPPPPGSETPPIPPSDNTYDLLIYSLDVPYRVVLGETTEIEVEVANSGPASASGTITLTGISNRGATFEFAESFTSLASGEEFEVGLIWTAPGRRPAVIRWTATVTSSGEDTNPSNDTATARTRVRRF